MTCPHCRDTRRVERKNPFGQPVLVTCLKCPPPLTNARLRELARRRPPPPSWYEETIRP